MFLGRLDWDLRPLGSVSYSSHPRATVWLCFPSLGLVFFISEMLDSDHHEAMLSLMLLTTYKSILPALPLLNPKKPAWPSGDASAHS